MGKTTRKINLPRGVTIRENKKSKTIWVAFTYKGVPCREPLSGWPTDKSNITAAGNLLGEIKNKITNNVFRYADYFPNSKKLKLFGRGVSNASIGFYLERAITEAENKGLKTGSLKTYKSRTTVLKKYLGNTPITQFDSRSARELAQELAVSMENSTLNSTFKVLRAAFNEAVVDGTITNNPLLGFKISSAVKRRKSKQKSKVQPFTLTELKKLAAFQDLRERTYIQVWAKTGLRSGELCALRWEHVDLERKIINIDENYVTYAKELGTPKTEASERTIQLDEETVSLLQILEPGKLPFVFHNSRSKREHFDTYSLRRLLIKMCGECGVSYRHPYNLRHTYATMRISLGHNLWDIAKQMGHTSPKMLFETYGDYIEEYAEETINSHPQHTRIFESIEK